MRVLVVSGELIGASLCQQLQREGHDVKLYIERPGWKKCLEGIVPKTDNWLKELGWVGKNGLIIFDDVDLGVEQEELRRLGYRVVGGSAGGDFLERNREFFQDLLNSLSISVLPSYDFNTVDAAMRFVTENPKRWVIKQNAHLGMLNYVGEREDAADALGVLQTYKNHGITSIHLQERAVGIEVGVARYFNGNDWVGPIEINHEHKKLCNGDIGPFTHEMGTVIWYSDDDALPLFSSTLAKLKPHLQEIDFRGDIDINCIVTETNIWPLEATPRFGNPSTPLQCELHNSPWSEFLGAVADGTPYDLSYKNGYGIVVCIALPCLSIPPHILDPLTFEAEETPLCFKEILSDEDWAHVHFEEISKRSSESEQSSYYWAGTDGWTMHVTAHDVDIYKARQKVYALVDKIILPQMMYRTDVGIRVAEHDLPRLRSWGWI